MPLWLNEKEESILSHVNKISFWLALDGSNHLYPAVSEPVGTDRGSLDYPRYPSYSFDYMYRYFVYNDDDRWKVSLNRGKEYQQPGRRATIVLDILTNGNIFYTVHHTHESIENGKE